MEWVGIDVARLGGWFVRTFWNREGYAAFPDVDMARNVVLTFATFAVGWLVSLRAARHRLKNRIIDELIMSQRELARRAYPDDFDGEWKQGDTREVWMLAPLVARIRFLLANLNEERSVSKKARTLMEVYIEKVDDFIAQWAVTQTRHTGASYEYKFLQTHDLFKAAAKAIGHIDSSKTRGLLPKRFIMRTRAGAPEKPPPVANGISRLAAE